MQVHYPRKVMRAVKRNPHKTFMKTFLRYLLIFLKKNTSYCFLFNQQTSEKDQERETSNTSSEKKKAHQRPDDITDDKDIKRIKEKQEEQDKPVNVLLVRFRCITGGLYNNH